MKDPSRYLRTCSLTVVQWLSANMVVSSFAIGALAVPVFSLGFVDALLTILFINLLGITPVCFFSMFGPKFGLRQMVLSRFWFGYYGVKLIAIFNILACVGWSSVNVIVGSQLINAVNGDVPGYAGIIIIAAWYACPIVSLEAALADSSLCSTLIITLFGYKIVHLYEFWSWIPSFIIFMIVLGQFAHSGDFTNIPMGVGTSEIGGVLSFAASVYGFATGWTSYAADYTVYQPAKTSRARVFFWTWLGLIVPLCFTEMLGLAVATTYQHPPLDADPETFVGNIYTQGYNSAKIGGLLGAVLVPAFGRFGQFCLVVLALSIIANNCPNIYSLSLSLQVLARKTQAVPRFLWTFLGTIVYCAIAIPGYGHFESVLENFMLVIGYWLAIYEGVSITDHFVFKRGFGGYDVALYNRPGELPPGVAAVGAFLFGVLGAVMGMAQVWFIGPIGKRIGNPMFGGDIGFPLAFTFAAVSYVILRTIERRVAGR
jgi:NCS1 nucleoside transporter family